MNTLSTAAFTTLKAATRLSFIFVLFTLMSTPLGAQTMTTIAGLDSAGFGGDKGPAEKACLSYPDAISVDAKGNIYVGDDHNNRIRVIDGKTGLITTLAGDGNAGFSGDGGPASEAEINGPTAMAFDKQGNMYFGDEANGRIRKIDAKTHIITTIAGNGLQQYSGDGGLAVNASFMHPSGIAIDADGNIFIADWGSSTIRKVDAKTGIIITIAGVGEGDFYGDGGPAVKAALNSCNEIAIDKNGNLYVTDSYNNRIRKIDGKTGIITTIAGSGDAGFSGNGGIALAANLNGPTGLAVDTNGGIYFSDYGNNCIRYINSESGIINTVAGDGEFGFGGDGSDPLMAHIAGAEGVALDAEGNLFIADNSNNRIRKVEAPKKLQQLTINADNNDMLVYPNPARDIATVKVNVALQEGSTLTMFNMSGQQVWTKNMEANVTEFTVDVSNMPMGIYFLRLYSPDGSICMKKVVVQR